MLKLQITSKEYSLKENNVSVFCGLIDGYTILKGYWEIGYWLLGCWENITNN